VFSLSLSFGGAKEFLDGNTKIILFLFYVSTNEELLLLFCRIKKIRIIMYGMCCSVILDLSLMSLSLSV
jgi:hypothetical protein